MLPNDMLSKIVETVHCRDNFAFGNSSFDIETITNSHVCFSKKNRVCIYLKYSSLLQLQCYRYICNNCRIGFGCFQNINTSKTGDPWLKYVHKLRNNAFYCLNKIRPSWLRLTKAVRFRKWWILLQLKDAKSRFTHVHKMQSKRTCIFLRKNLITFIAHFSDLAKRNHQRHKNTFSLCIIGGIPRQSDRSHRKWDWDVIKVAESAKKGVSVNKRQFLPLSIRQSFHSSIF
jgi:hypothetical protein